jgi:hypothetical protein
MKVLVIGAGEWTSRRKRCKRHADLFTGTTGLLIAQGLKKNGIPFEIFEREESYESTKRSREWGMVLHCGVDSFTTLLPEDLLERLP